MKKLMKLDILRGDLRDEVSKLTSELQKLRIEHTHPATKGQLPNLVYHYTDDEGLKGILNSGELWFTHVFNLNDPSEIRHGFGIGHELLTKVVRDRTEILRGIISDLKMDTFAELGLKVFTCSFSTDKDELAQWRAYADDGRGYAIGFDTRLLVKSDDFSIYPVRYDDDGLTSRLQVLIEAAKAFLIKYDGFEPDTQEEMAVGHVISCLVGCFLLVSMLHKHEDYQRENEVRLVLRNADRIMVKYRTRPYSLVKYIPYRYRESQAIKEIVIGPSTNSVSSQFALDCLNAFYGDQEDVEINTSRIPYRPTR